jgi:hypothetical protein
VDANTPRSQKAMDVALLQERIRTLDEWIANLTEDYRRAELQALAAETKAAVLSTLAAQLQKIQNVRAAAFIELAKRIGDLA